MAVVVEADNMILLPATTAAVDSPNSSPLCARCAATSEEEQAVSVLMQGPAWTRHRHRGWLLVGKAMER